MICPACQKEVPVSDHQIGALFTCPKCQAVYFINFDGAPEYSSEENESVAGLNAPAENKKKYELHEATPVPTEEFQSQSFEENQFFNTNPIESPSEFSQPESIDEVIPQIQQIQSFNESPTFVSVADEIADFGNQDSDIAALNYDLKISGLDTKEILTLFKEVIDDSKFGWLSEDILKKCKTGVCELKELNPAQAYILAKRLQFIDVELEWTQNVFSN